MLLGWKVAGAVALAAAIGGSVLLWRLEAVGAARDLLAKDLAAATRELAIADAVNARQQETIGRFDAAAARNAADAAAASARAARLAHDYDTLLGDLRHAQDAPAADVLRRAYLWVQQRPAAADRADGDGGDGLPGAGRGAAGGVPDAAGAGN